MPNSKKSASGSGNIRKKTVTRNGKPYTYWEGRVTVGVDPRTGKQKQRSISGKTQKEVAQKLRQITSEIDNGIYTEPSKLSLGEWLDTWLEQYLGGIKPRTIALYKDCVKLYLKPTLGKVKLKKYHARRYTRSLHFFPAQRKSPVPKDNQEYPWRIS